MSWTRRKILLNPLMSRSVDDRTTQANKITKAALRGGAGGLGFGEPQRNFAFRSRRTAFSSPNPSGISIICPLTFLRIGST